MSGAATHAGRYAAFGDASRHPPSPSDRRKTPASVPRRDSPLRTFHGDLWPRDAGEAPFHLSPGNRIDWENYMATDWWMDELSSAGPEHRDSWFIQR